MRIFSGGLLTETNTFSPIPTGLGNFEKTCLVRDGRFEDPPSFWVEPNAVWQRMAATRGWAIVTGLCTGAQPAGLTARSVYESLRDELLDGLRAAMPVDMVLLNLHGAMVAHGYDDCEGDILERVRTIVGPTVPIGAELDLHCHVTPRMVEQATALIAYKEYPHVDAGPRAAELFDLIADAAAGRTKPRTSVFDCRMMGLFATPPEPMRGFVDRMAAEEGKNSVLSVSLSHGFLWGDVADAGAKLWVVTDGRPDVGDALAESLGREFFALRDKVSIATMPMDEAFRRAASHNRGTVVIADSSDNPGGGAPGDSTTLLRRLIESGIRDAAFGALWDPIAVELAFEAGEGAVLDMRLGGKMGPMSDAPLDLRVEVKGLRRNLVQSFGPSIDHMGDAAHVEHDGIDIVLITHRTQILGREAFTSFGIDLGARKAVIVKSSQHFYAAFAPVAQEVLYVTAPGLSPPRYADLDFRHIARPKWPLDASPFGG
ncbi:MAG: M81 family peptidase [Alphaproteobacteria bacterium]|nr:M81 family peptidase [Alphaproteobacteria bacterium]